MKPFAYRKDEAEQAWLGVGRHGLPALKRRSRAIHSICRANWGINRWAGKHPAATNITRSVALATSEVLESSLMAITDLVQGFEMLKSTRRTMPEEALIKIGQLASESLEELSISATSHPIAWGGGGEKNYKVFSIAEDNKTWSRAVNTHLFIDDPGVFDSYFHEFANRVMSDRGRLVVSDLTSEEIDEVIYTTVLSFAVITGLYDLGRGLAGTFFEMTVGAVLSLLTGRAETGDIILPVPGTSEKEIIKVDLTFHDPNNGVSLAVPTKISTRERISQAFVHARILDTACPGQYRNILCIVNENNAFHYQGAKKSISSLYLRDTLVPGTIALYQRYVAKLDALYYLDPPEQYLAGERAGLPPVRRFSDLLLGDLVELLA